MKIVKFGRAAGQVVVNDFLFHPHDTNVSRS